MEQRKWFGYYIKTNNTTTEQPTRTVRTNSALGERASDGRDPRDPPSKSGNLLGTWAIRADMPGTRRIIGTTDYRWQDRSFALDLQQWLEDRALGQLLSKLKAFLSDSQNPLDRLARFGLTEADFATMGITLPLYKRALRQSIAEYRAEQRECAYLFNFLDRHVLRFFPASLSVFLSPQLGNGIEEDCAICLEALVVGEEDIWFSLVSPSIKLFNIYCTPSQYRTVVMLSTAGAEQAWSRTPKGQVRS